MNIVGKRVAYITLGCKLNFSETSTIKHNLEQGGSSATVGEKDGADIFVINTCSVTDIAEKKGRQMIRKIIHRNPGSYIVVVGCYAQLRAQEIMNIEGVHLDPQRTRQVQRGPLFEPPRRTGTTRTTFL